MATHFKVIAKILVPRLKSLAKLCIKVSFKSSFFIFRFDFFFSFRSFFDFLFLNIEDVDGERP